MAVRRSEPGIYSGVCSDVTHIPLVSSSSKSTKKLSSIEINEKIRPILCQVNMTDYSGSGFLFHMPGSKEIRVVTCYHLNPFVLIGDKLKIQVIGSNDGFLLQDGKEYGFEISFPGKDNPSLEYSSNLANYIQNVCERIDIISLEIFKPNIKIPHFQIIGSNFSIKPGQKIYFAGFPFNRTEATFHEGKISSVFLVSGYYNHFTIDGTVVPGNSGGPVFIQERGKLYLIGIILSEVIELDPYFAQLHEQLSTQVIHNRPKEDSDEKTMKDFIEKLYSFVKGNLSTGVGTALDARYLVDLNNNEPLPIPTAPKIVKEVDFTPTTSSNLSVGRPSVHNNFTSSKYKKVDYHELRYQGGNNRGVHIKTLLEGDEGVQYKFDPDPHHSKKYFKANEAANFYRKAAEKYSTLNLITEGKFSPPTKFKFKMWKVEFTAELTSEVDDKKLLHTSLLDKLNDLIQEQENSEFDSKAYSTFIMTALHNLNFGFESENLMVHQEDPTKRFFIPRFLDATLTTNLLEDICASIIE